MPDPTNTPAAGTPSSATPAAVSPPAAVTPPVATSAAGGEATPAGTILDSTPAVDPAQVTPQADWPEDWRERLATVDGKVNDKALKLLSRMGSVQGVVNKMLNQEAMISSGQYKKGLPENATPEQLAAFRKDNGIPETAEGYKAPEGLVMGENDKPLLKGFFEKMHAKNYSQEVVQDALSYYFDNVAQAQAKQEEDDLGFRQSSTQTLLKEWGGQYQSNLNAVKGLFAMAPEEVRDSVMSARLGNGKLLGDDPNALRFLLNMAREINPAASIIPGGNESTAQLGNRLTQLETVMKTKGMAYWHSKENDGPRNEYYQLLEAKVKMDGRAA